MPLPGVEQLKAGCTWSQSQGSSCHNQSCGGAAWHLRGDPPNRCTGIVTSAGQGICFLGHTRESLKTSYSISILHLRLHSPFTVAGLRWFTANLGNGFPLLWVSPSFDVLAPRVMNRGAWWATAHRVSKSQTQWKQACTHCVS